MTDYVDFSEQLRRSQYLADRDTALNPVVSKILGVLAELFFFFYTLRSDALFHIRQFVYKFERAFKYGARSPQEIRKQVSDLTKLPEHVAFVLKVSPTEAADALSTLLKHATECVSWCVGCGVESLTLYERTGLLKAVPCQSVAELLATGLARYFDELPLIAVRSGAEKVTAGSVTNRADGRPVLEVILAAESSGRPLMVELANEYSQELADGVIAFSDITVAKVDRDVQQRIGSEPDLLVSFDSNLDVDGFSPWLLRVTELFCLPDNEGVFHYMVFRKALDKFATVKINLGA